MCGNVYIPHLLPSGLAMLICAIDTSGREGSLALAEGNATAFRVLHLAPIAGGTYSSQLIPTISNALSECGRRKSQIELLVAASGPGSFTGLRVGLSTVKALAEVLRAPIVSVSVLEAIAFEVKRDGLLLTALDAQRNEVFVGEYESKSTQDSSREVQIIQEVLLSGEGFVSSLNSRSPVPMTYSPDAAVEKRLREAGLPVKLVSRPAADVYARVGLQKFLAGETVPADTLDANYIRRSDAEIFSSPRLPILPK